MITLKTYNFHEVLRVFFVEMLSFISILFEKYEIKEEFGMIRSMIYLHSKTLNENQGTEFLADERGDL